MTNGNFIAKDFVEFQRAFSRAARDENTTALTLNQLVRDAGRSAWLAAKTGIFGEQLALAVVEAEKLYGEVLRGERPELSFTLKRKKLELAVLDASAVRQPEVIEVIPDLISPRYAEYIQRAQKLFWRIKIIPHLVERFPELFLGDDLIIMGKYNATRFDDEIENGRYCKWPIRLLDDFDASLSFGIDKNAFAWILRQEASIHAHACQAMGLLIPTQKLRERLKKTEIDILVTVKQHARSTAETIAEKMGRNCNGDFRTTLSGLCRFKFLENITGQGYVLTTKGKDYLEQQPKS